MGMTDVLGGHRLRQTAWPSLDQWRAFLKFLVLFDVLFFPVYIGGNYIASHSVQATGLFLDWETRIPLVPWMILPYLSLYSVFLLPLFHLRPAEMTQLCRQSTMTLAVAGLFFVLLPTRLGFPPVPVAGMMQPLFETMRAVDVPQNLVPSLHVAFCALILLPCAERAAAPLRWLYRGWLVTLSASTVLVHQHHLLDVATGLGLAVAVGRILPLKLAPSSWRAGRTILPQSR
jgi:membrane-associated phospholipid phosphatase